MTKGFHVFALLVLLTGASISFAQPYYYSARNQNDSTTIWRLNLVTNVQEQFMQDTLYGDYDLSTDPTQTWLFLKPIHGPFTVVRTDNPSIRTIIPPDGDVDDADIRFVPQLNRFYCAWSSGQEDQAASYDGTTFAFIDSLPWYPTDLFSPDGSLTYFETEDTLNHESYTDAYSTSTYQLVHRKNELLIGPPTLHKFVYNFMSDNELYTYIYPLPDTLNGKYQVYNLGADTAYPAISFPTRSEGHLSGDAKYVIIAEARRAPDGYRYDRYRSGNVYVYESRTARFVSHLSLPPDGEILIFPNHPDTMYYYLPDEQRAIDVDLSQLRPTPGAWLKLRVFLQGATAQTDGTTMSTILNINGILNDHFNENSPRLIPPSAVDSINIEIRSSTSADHWLAPAWLLSDGRIRDFADTSKDYISFDSAMPGPYYIIVRHRNHVPVMSSEPQSLGAIPTLYDFTRSQSRAYGIEPMQNVSGDTLFAMVAGDVNQNGTIGSGDTTLISSGIELSGPYSATDVNFDGHTLSDDLQVATQNLGRKSQLPHWGVRVGLRVFLQGAIREGTDSMATDLRAHGVLAAHFADHAIPALAVDSIELELRSAESGPALDSTPAWLMSNGTIESFWDTTKNYAEFEYARSGYYYVVVRHRNHLAIMSAQPQLLQTGAVSVYDFATSQGQAFGSNPMVEIGGTGLFAMVAGDVNGDGMVYKDDIIGIGEANVIPYFQDDLELRGSPGGQSLLDANFGRQTQVPSKQY